MTNTGDAPITSYSVCNDLPGNGRWNNGTITSTGSGAAFRSDSSCEVEVFSTGPLAPGQTSVTDFTVTVKHPSPIVGDLLDTAWTRYVQAGPISVVDGQSLRDSDQVPLAVRTPTLSLETTPDVEDSQTFLVGTSSSYVIRLRNPGSTAATNVTVTAPIPTHLSYPGGASVAVTGSPVTVVTSGGPASAPTFSINRLEPGGEVRIILPVNHDGTSASVQSQFVLTASAAAPGLTTLTDPGSLFAQSSATLPSITKTASSSLASPGETVDFTVEVTIPAAVGPMYDLTVIDRLPDGLSYVGPSTAVCVDAPAVSGDCDGVAEVEMLPTFVGIDSAAGVPVDATGGQQVAWYLGDLAASNDPVTYRITFPTRVDVTYDGTGEPPAGAYVASGAPGGDPLTNRAQIGVNMVNRLGGVPAGVPAIATFDLRTPAAAAAVAVESPTIDITKTTSDERLEAGDTVTYTVQVHNSGNAPAYQVEVHDTLGDGLLRSIAMDPANPVAATIDASGATWVIPGPVPADGWVTLRYSAVTPPSSELVPNLTAINSDPVAVDNVVELIGYDTTAGGAGPGNVHYAPPEDETVRVIIDTPIMQIGTAVLNGTIVCPVAEEGEVWNYRTVAGNINSTMPALAGNEATAYDPTVQITLPAGLELVDGTLRLYLGGVESALVPTVTTLPDGATVLTYDDLPDIAGRQSSFVVVEYSGRIGAGGASAGVATRIDALDASGVDRRGDAVGAEYEYTASHVAGCFPPPRLVKEPTVPGGTVDRADPAGVFPGDPYTFSITISNPGAELDDAVLVDTLPAGLTFVGPVTTQPAAATTVTTSPAPGGATEIRVVFTDPLAGATTHRIDVPVTVDPTSAPGLVYINTAVLETSTPVGQAGCNPGTLCDSGAIEVRNPAMMSVEHAVDDYGPHLWGSTVTYTVDLRIPAFAAFDDVVVAEILADTSTLPTGWWPYSVSPRGYIDAYCLSGCTHTGSGSVASSPDDITVQTLPVPLTEPSNVSTTDETPLAGWYVNSFGINGQVVSDSDERIVRFVMRAIIAPSHETTNFNAMQPEYRSVEYSSRVEVRHSLNPAFSVPATSQSWRNGSYWGAMTVAGEDSTVFGAGVGAPTVDKDCYRPDDPLVRTDSADVRLREVTPGSTNLRCEIIVENRGGLPVYSISLEDRPDLTTAAWQVTSYALPPNLALTQVAGPGNQWVTGATIPQLDPGQTVAFTIDFHVDYWTGRTIADLGPANVGTTRNDIVITRAYANPLATRTVTNPGVQDSAFVRYSLPAFDLNKRGVDGSTYAGTTADAIPGQPYTWEINLDYWGEEALEAITIQDTLPVGWRYVPGSARLITSAGWTNVYDFTRLSGYDVVPLSDGSVSSSSATCDTAVDHEGGDSVTWVFDRDSAANQPWQTNPTDPGVVMQSGAGTFEFDPNVMAGFDDLLQNPFLSSASGHDPYTQLGFGDLFLSGDWGVYAEINGVYQTLPSARDVFQSSAGVYNTRDWRRLVLVFDAVPDISVLDCVTELGVPEPFENNVTASGLRASSANSLGDAATALAEIDDILEVVKTPDAAVVADGGTATFDVAITNYSPDAPFTDLTITDDLVGTLAWGSGYIPGTATISGTSGTFTENAVVNTGGDQHISWHLDRIEPGETAHITLSITVPEDTADGTLIPNTVTVSTPDYLTDLTDTGDITVRNPTPPPPVTKTMPATARPGETFDVAVDVAIPASHAYLDLFVADLLPEGVSFESYGSVDCAISGGGACPAWPVATVPADTSAVQDRAGWWFGDLIAAPQDRVYTLHYRATVATDAAAGAVLVNRAASFDNLDANLIDDLPALPPFDLATTPPTATGFDAASPQPATAQTVVVRPSLIIDKRVVTPGPLEAGDDVGFEITVTNVGTGDAFDVEVTDTLGEGVASVTPGNGGSLVDAWTPTDPTMGWLVDTIPAGATASISYTVELADDLDDLIAAGLSSLDNTADVVSYTDASPTAEHRNVSTEVDPASTSTPLAGSDLAVEKLAGSCATGSENQTAVRGARTTWCLRVTNAGAASVPGVDVHDDLPADLAFVPGSATVDGLAAAPDTTTVGTTERLTWTIGPVDPGQVVLIEYELDVDPTATGRIVNTARLVPRSPSGSPAARTRPPDWTDTAALTVLQAAQSIEKLPDEQLLELVGVGGPVTWTINATNTGATPLTGVVVEDQLPAGLTFSSSTDDFPGGLTPVVGATGAGPGGSTELSWTIPTIAVGQTVAIVVTADVPATVVFGDSFVNTASIRSDQIPVPSANQARLRVFGDVNPPTLTFALDRDEVVVGESFQGTYTITLPPDQYLYDVMLTGTLPPGLVFDDTVAVTCVSGCEPFTTDERPPVVGAGGDTEVSWWLGQVRTQTEPMVIEVTIRGHAIELVGAGPTRTPDAGLFDVDGTLRANPLPVVVELPGDPVPDEPDCPDCTFTFVDGPDLDALDVVEPRLTLDKDASCDPTADPQSVADDDRCTVAAGTRVHFDVIVGNVGDHDAFDVDVADVVPAGLVDVVVDQPALVTDGWTAADPDIVWRFDQLSETATTTVGYWARVDPAVDHAAALVNHAEVTVYWAAAATDRTPDHVPGLNPVPDVVSLTTQAPRPLIDIDASCDPGRTSVPDPDSCLTVPGTSIHWWLSVTNPTDADAYDVAVDIGWPDGLVDRTTLVLPPGVTATPTGWVIDVLPAGTTTTIELGARLATTATVGTPYEVHAEVTELYAVPASIDRVPVSLVEPVVDDVVVTPANAILAVTKTVDCGGGPSASCATVPGQQVRYAVTVRNTGAVPAYDVQLVDQMDQGIRVVELLASPQTLTDPWSFDDPDLAWTLADPIPPGESVTIEYTAEVTGDRGVERTNTASVTAGWPLPAGERTSTTPAATLGPPAQASVRLGLPVIGLAKRVSCGDALGDGCSVLPGGVVTYELVVSNHGDVPATSVVVRDVPAAGLTVQAVAPAGARLTDPWTADDPDLEWVVDGPVAPGGSFTITYTAVVGRDIGGGGSLANTALVESLAAPSVLGSSVAVPHDPASTRTQVSVSVVTSTGGRPSALAFTGVGAVLVLAAGVALVAVGSGLEGASRLVPHVVRSRARRRQD